MSQIKSKSRVRDLAEVYTAEREVNAMLDLVKDESYRIESRFLEPSCGNGNFLIEILRRKLKTVSEVYSGPKNYEFLTILALGSTYGVDIDKENVKEARARLKAEVINQYSSVLNTQFRSNDFDRSVDYVLKTNIIQGDMLNRVSHIRFTEYQKASASYRTHQINKRVFRLFDMLNGSKDDLFKDDLTPVSAHGPMHYTKIWENSNEGE